MIIHIVILLENNIQGYIGITLSVYLSARLSVRLSVRGHYVFRSKVMVIQHVKELSDQLMFGSFILSLWYNLVYYSLTEFLLSKDVN